MKVSRFNWLLEIWKLVDKDPSETSIILHSGGASVSGMHVAASRKLKLPLEKKITVNGEALVGAMKLFPNNAELGFKDTGTSLVLSAKRRRVVLRRMLLGSPLRKSPDFKGKKFSAKVMRKAVPFLRSVVQGGVMQPILTGIQFTPGKKKNRVILESTDAAHRTGRLTVQIPMTVKNQVVPAADLDQALSLMQTKLQMQFVNGAVEIGDGTTTIRISLLNGKFPDLSKLPLLKTFKNRILLSRSRLDNAVKAAALLDDDRLVSLVIKDGRAAWLIRGSERGGFREPIGKTDLEDIEIVFDSHWLDTAQDLGSDFMLVYKNSKAPVLFHTANRLLWMSPIVKAMPTLDE